MSTGLGVLQDPSSTQLDQVALQCWVEKNQRALLAYAQALSGEREMARDLVQETLLMTWRLRKRFDANQGDLGSWIRGILRNKWRDVAKKRRLEIHDPEEIEAIEGLHRQWEFIVSKGQGDLIDLVHICLSQLSGSLEEAVKQYYFFGWSSAEVAKRMNSSEVATRKRLQRAREAIKSCLEQKEAQV